MTENEKFIFTVGELLATEIEEVEEVNYDREHDDRFYVTMKNGKKFTVCISDAQ